MCRQMAVVAGQLEPCEFPSLESCQKRFLWSHKEVDLAPHPVVGRQYIVMHATLTARDFFLNFANFYPSGLFTCTFSKTSPEFFLC